MMSSSRFVACRPATAAVGRTAASFTSTSAGRAIASGSGSDVARGRAGGFPMRKKAPILQRSERRRRSAGPAPVTHGNRRHGHHADADG
ncbi:hypothetical protein BURCENBC7_AP3627 [Burkholderia cenocepacia BC7]|nr:hypothetical protein BURCENBC7_AP3627 [Burkholderia cenocepacia BC7]